ncbi:MAG: endonuclease Q family protein [bacterium]|nr:endonuclease Q family protein [bacterium]
MRTIIDFHIHSRFSRATSKELNLRNLANFAEIKGIKVLGTGDFTHPIWFKELKEGLEPAEPGLFKVKKQVLGKNGASGEETRFILTAEISCIYSKNNRVRRIHLLIISPTFEAVEKINARLEWIGNLKADGRPILGLDAKELLKIVLQTSPASIVVPAHVFTPWFALFGSKSGFDSVEECFEEYSKYIFALETGMSADPKMCWRLSSLDKYTLISNSDSHSLRRIGREANVFEGEDLSYQEIIKAIKKTSQSLKLIYTIEFFPEEGRYHYDGHRACGISYSPAETKKSGGTCPVCGKPLTIGVLSRVEQLADRPEGIAPEGAIPFKSLVPLKEIIGEALGVLPGAKKVEEEYQSLIKKLGSEFKILVEANPSELTSATLPEVVEGISRVRQGKLIFEPGFDGVYGKVRIFSQGEQKTISKQKSLF